MLIPMALAGMFTALAVLGVLRRNPLFVRLGFFLFGGMIVTFNTLGLLAGEVTVSYTHLTLPTNREV